MACTETGVLGTDIAAIVASAVGLVQPCGSQRALSAGARQWSHG